MKFKLREYFSIDFGDGNVVVGPCEVELNEKQFELEKHKVEEIASEEPEDDKPKKKKKDQE